MLIFFQLWPGRVVAGNVALESWVTPFSLDSARQLAAYQWESKPSQRYHICAFIPSSETSYWFAVNYGLVKKAQALGVSLKVFHTDTENLVEERLKAMLQNCASHKPDSIIIDNDFSGLRSQFETLFNRPVNVIAVGKNMMTRNITASTSPSYSDIGFQLADYLNQHYQSTRLSQGVIFPGDRHQDYVKSFVDGFTPHVNKNRFHFKDTIYTTDNYVDIKAAITRYLNANLDTSIIVGSAKVAQAAVEVLHEMSLTGDVKIVSYEMSAQVYRDIKRGKVAVSITNSPVVQGNLAVDLAIKLSLREIGTSHFSPQSRLVDEQNVLTFDISRIFAPYGYRETLEVN